ncbi:MAG: hypothetical protein ACTTJH_00655 [Bacteroidales bacterium]
MRQKGDSVFVEKIVYNDRIVRDTIAKTDTIRVNEIKTIEKEKQRSWKEKILSGMEVVMFGLIVGIGIIIVYRIARDR